MRRRSALALAIVLGATAAWLPPAPRADERPPAPASATWRAECGACHVAYPPRLLPVRSWRALMGGLDRHFGVDASLDPAMAAEIAAFLERQAGPDRGGPAELRITGTAWFQRKHRKIPPAVWAVPIVKGAADCNACHPAADRGQYDDDTVRLPR